MRSRVEGVGVRNCLKLGGGDTAGEGWTDKVLPRGGRLVELEHPMATGGTNGILFFSEFIPKKYSSENQPPKK